MDERERIIREVIKVLPELAKSLNRDVAMHPVAMGQHGGARGPANAGPGRGASDSGPALPSAAEISGAQLRTLVHLAQYGPQTMGELAEGLQITMASTTGLVKPLVALGYVIRSRDERDQRVVRVRLSSSAQAMADRIIAERRREVEAALAGMDEAECRVFLEGLERLVGRRR